MIMKKNKMLISIIRLLLFCLAVSYIVVTGVFLCVAVQHIGLYAQALNRRGVYDPESADPRSLRVALASRVMAVHLCGEHRVAAAIISSVPPQNNERKENKGVSRECV